MIELDCLRGTKLVPGGFRVLAGSLAFVWEAVDLLIGLLTVATCSCYGVYFDGLVSQTFGLRLPFSNYLSQGIFYHFVTKL